MQSLERAVQFLLRPFPELRQPHIAELVVVERELPPPVNVLDRLDRDVRADELVVFRGARGRAEHGQDDLGAGGAAHPVDGFGEADLLRASAVDFEDSVAGHDPGSGGGGVVHRGDDGEGVAPQTDLDSDAAEFAFGVLLEVVVLLGLHELAVGVERAEHPFERAVDQVLIREAFAVHVIVPNFLENEREQAQVPVDVVLLGNLGRTQIDLGAEDQVDRKGRQQHRIHQSLSHSPFKEKPCAGK